MHVNDQDATVAPALGQNIVEGDFAFLPLEEKTNSGWQSRYLSFVKHCESSGISNLPGNSLNLDKSPIIQLENEHPSQPV